MDGTLVSVKIVFLEGFGISKSDERKILLIELQSTLKRLLKQLL